MLTRAGLPDIRIHVLRHTTASLALKGKVHPKIFQNLLGHSIIGVTMDTYSHIKSSMCEGAAEENTAMLAQAN
ncbi:site-specific tyrosine recombinase XerC [compost metagenome]